MNGIVQAFSRKGPDIKSIKGADYEEFQHDDNSFAWMKEMFGVPHWLGKKWRGASPDAACGWDYTVPDGTELHLMSSLPIQKGEFLPDETDMFEWWILTKDTELALFWLDLIGDATQYRLGKHGVVKRGFAA